MILLACSAGGHLTEMQQLEKFYSQFDHCFVTFKRNDTEKLSKAKKVYFVERPARNPINVLRNIWDSHAIIRKEKPSLVLSLGADVTIGVSLWAKVYGIPLVFVESYAQVYSPSLTGRIMKHLATHILYQWPTNKSFYPNGIYAGSILAEGRL